MKRLPGVAARAMGALRPPQRRGAVTSTVTGADRRPWQGRGAALAAVGALLAASGCAVHLGAAAPARSPVPVGSAPVPAAAASTRADGAAYLALAVPANRRLDTDFDRLDGPDRHDLAAARADLRDIAATEHDFDRHLAGLALPVDAEGWARTLIRVNESRADLTARAAASPSTARLDGLRPALTAANVPVERAVTAVRADLGLPPPDTH